MSDKAFKLEVITPDRVVMTDGGVASAVLPGSQGYMGILAGHAPLMAELNIGQIDIRRSDGTTDAIAISGGFMEVLSNTVTVLADTAELAGEIDEERAEEAKRRAQDRITQRTPNMDVERAEIALKKSLNRLRVKSGRKV